MPSTSTRGQKRLGENGEQGAGKLNANLFLLLGGEGVDDAVDGAAGTSGVQGSEDQVARFSSLDGGGDGFEIAHFTDQNHVRILTQSAAERFGEGRNVAADFTLGDDRFFVLVVILEGIFRGDDVAFKVDVDVIDHGSEGGGFAGACWAGDEEHAARAAAEFFDGGGKADLFEGEELVGNFSKNEADVAFLPEDGNAETGSRGAVCGGEGEPEVGGAHFLEFLLGAVGGDGFHERDGVIRFENFGGKIAQTAVHAEDGGRPTEMWRSEAPFLMVVSSRRSIWIVDMVSFQFQVRVSFEFQVSSFEQISQEVPRLET